MIELVKLNWVSAPLSPQDALQTTAQDQERFCPSEVTVSVLTQNHSTGVEVSTFSLNDWILALIADAAPS